MIFCGKVRKIFYTDCTAANFVNEPVVDNKNEKPGKAPETGDTTPTYYLGVAVVTLKVRKRNSF